MIMRRCLVKTRITSDVQANGAPEAVSVMPTSNRNVKRIASICEWS